jgi:hypothetical protein
LPTDVMERPGVRCCTATLLTTRSPAASSRCATDRPAPMLPSTAQVRSDHNVTFLRIAAYATLSMLNPALGQDRLLLVDDLDRRRELVRINPDGHPRHDLRPSRCLLMTPGGQ